MDETKQPYTAHANGATVKTIYGGSIVTVVSREPYYDNDGKRKPGLDTLTVRYERGDTKTFRANELERP